MAEIPSAKAAGVRFEINLLEEADGTRRSGLRRGNRISFGAPAIYDLLALLAANGAEVPYDLRRERDRYEFWLLRLACTLHPSPGSALSWFDLQVALEEAAAGTGLDETDPADPPLAYDLYPSEVTDKVRVQHTARIAPRLEFEEVTASLGEDALTLRYQRLEPRITAFGKREQRAYWRFAPGAGHHVAEGIKEMDLIVRRRRGTRVRATLLVAGRGLLWGVLTNPPQLADQRFEF
jgi:hypothetical protein